MGALVSKALRPLKSFNIENRAHRVISKEKPTPAPKYASNLEDIKRAIQAEPDLDDKIARKHADLDERLKNVYVTSDGPAEDDITKEKKDPNRLLPLDRKIVPDFELGFKEVDKVPYGRTTLRDVMNFLSAHQATPKEHTVNKIALDYKLKEEDINNIVKYFKTFEIYLPATKTTKATFAGPANFRRLEEERAKQLESEAESVVLVSRKKERLFNFNKKEEAKVVEKQ